jgi:hypothetical protein
MKKTLWVMILLPLNFSHADIIDDVKSSIKDHWSPVEKKYSLDKCFKMYELNPLFRDKANQEILKYEYKKSSQKNYDTEEFGTTVIVQKPLTATGNKLLNEKGPFTITPEQCAKMKTDECYKLSKEEAKKLIQENPLNKDKLAKQFNIYDSKSSYPFLASENVSWINNGAIKILGQELVVTSIVFEKTALLL